MRYCRHTSCIIVYDMIPRNVPVSCFWLHVILSLCPSQPTFIEDHLRTRQLFEAVEAVLGFRSGAQPHHSKEQRKAVALLSIQVPSIEYLIEFRNLQGRSKSLLSRPINNPGYNYRTSTTPCCRHEIILNLDPEDPDSWTILDVASAWRVHLPLVT